MHREQPSATQHTTTRVVGVAMGKTASHPRRHRSAHRGARFGGRPPQHHLHALAKSIYSPAHDRRQRARPYRPCQASNSCDGFVGLSTLLTGCDVHFPSLCAPFQTVRPAMEYNGAAAAARARCAASCCCFAVCCDVDGRWPRCAPWGLFPAVPVSRGALCLGVVARAVWRCVVANELRGVASRCSIR
jgi:hypothetical protein